MPGHKMIQSDALSRQPDFIPDEDHDNEDITLLPDKLFVNLINTELQQRIAKSRSLDSDVADIIKALKGKGPTPIRHDLADWTTELFEGNQILFYKGKNYIPKEQTLRQDIVRQFHDSPTAGHPGELETFIAIREHYWWPGMRSFIKNYVKGCGICQQFKIN